MYRKVVWYLRGRKAYTKSGFQKAQKTFNEADLQVDVTGRSFVITGANSGLGYASAKAIAKRGGTIHMVCRSQERGQKALEQLKAETNNENIKLHLADMSKPQDIKAVVEELIKLNEPVHVLINNAGCMVHKRNYTDDGMEFNFAVNSFAPYLLTELLLPHMKKFEDPRVIYVSSGGMLLADLEVKDPMLTKVKDEDFKADEAYSHHKRQMVAMCEQYTKRHTDVGFYTMHPGWSDTDAVKEALPEFREKMKDDLRDEDEGADTIAWLALCKNIPESYKGEFIEDRQIASKHLFLARSHYSDEDAQKLMEWFSNKKTELNL